MEWAKGMACRVVEHDASAPGTPLDGGKTHMAVVETAGATYVQARLHCGSRTALWTFWQESGWGATPELSRWRLMPATDEDAATAAGNGQDQ